MAAKHVARTPRAPPFLVPQTRCISPPPCGEGLGVGVVRFFHEWRHRALTASPPSPTLPHKGGGSTPSAGRGCAPSSRRRRVGKGAYRSARSAAGAPCPRGLLERRKHDNVIACRVSATTKERVGNGEAAVAHPTRSQHPMSLPLSGLLVVSLEQAVAAPMCTCRLADAGARVIKVERPEGDFARYYDKLAVPRAAMAAKQAATQSIGTRSERAAPASPHSADSVQFPSPLWGGVRGGGGA